MGEDACADGGKGCDEGEFGGASFGGVEVEWVACEVEGGCSSGDGAEADECVGGGSDECGALGSLLN
jgi:hypothetical protein